MHPVSFHFWYNCVGVTPDIIPSFITQNVLKINAVNVAMMYLA